MVYALGFTGVLPAGISNVGRDRTIVASTREKVAAYEEGFNKIRAATGIASIEELVATFISNEVLRRAPTYYCFLSYLCRPRHRPVCEHSSLRLRVY